MNEREPQTGRPGKFSRRSRYRYLCFFGLLFLTCRLAAADVYQAGGTRLEFDRARKAFQLRVPGAPSPFSCDRLWDIRFFDDDARKANLRPADQFNIGCNEHYVQSKALFTSAAATLNSVRFDQKTGRFTAEYTHPSAAVKLMIGLYPDRAELQLEVTNRSKLPISSIYPVPGLAFRLDSANRLIVPKGSYSIEADGCRNCYYWGSCASWDGMLTLFETGKVFALNIFPDRKRPNDQIISHIDGDEATGKSLRYTGEYVCWLRPGETRRSQIIQLQGFPNLRSWADGYLAYAFPEGMKKLSEKYSADLWDRLRHSSWAAGEGKLAELLPVVANAPGRILLQNGNYMRPLKGAKAKIQLDSFPNYFPINPYFGTDAQYEQLIRRVAANGGIYVPRTSFFYWVKGSDFDLAHDLRKSAIVRIGGTPCTAKWGDMPGYIVSPSDPEAAKCMAGTAEKFKSLGAAGYFTNVICAVNVFSIRYDFHPDAPAPDLLYAQIGRMFRRHGNGTPLFAEGSGGIRLLPDLAGICDNQYENRDDPATNRPGVARFLIAPRLTWKPGLMLSHEYAASFPHNLKTHNATTTIQRLTHALVNGFQLKVGMIPEGQLTRRNILWTRTCAVFSQEVTSRLIGRRLLSYEEKDNIVRADYSGSRVTANFSDRGLGWKAGENHGTIAPDGFGFRNDAEGVAAGYFSELNGVKYRRPLLLLAVRTKGVTRLYAPLEIQPAKVVWNGSAVEIPGYSPCLERTVRGVTLAVNGKCTPDSAGNGFIPPAPQSGYDAPPPTPHIGNVPLSIDWDASKPLPPELKLTAPATVTREGIRLAGKNGTATVKLPSPYTRCFHAEMLIRYDRMPGTPDTIGNAPFLTAVLPPGSYYWSHRFVEFGYNLYRGEFIGNIVGKSGRFFWISLSGISIEPGKFYHVRLTVDHGLETLWVNGRERTRPFTESLRPTGPEWQIGGKFDYMTIAMIRLGGE